MEEKKNIKIAGVKRDTRFSPNHIDNDALIFSLTANCLRLRGYEVTEYTESEFVASEIAESVIFNMARDRYTIRKLQELEDKGRLVFNSGYGIENCTREKMTRILLSHQVPHPESVITKTVDTHDLWLLADGVEMWVKRGDFQAVQCNDVTFARTAEEVRVVLDEYASRGIETAVINKHLKGDLVKFYGVSGGDFFHWFYPTEANHSKFGLEKINGKPAGIAFCEQELKRICGQAAEVLGIHIYGGDCVVCQDDGSIKIIDFNDWPSFAPCRDDAAPRIAAAICAGIAKAQGAELELAATTNR